METDRALPEPESGDLNWIAWDLLTFEIETKENRGAQLCLHFFIKNLGDNCDSIPLNIVVRDIAGIFFVGVIWIIRNLWF